MIGRVNCGGGGITQDINSTLHVTADIGATITVSFLNKSRSFIVPQSGYIDYSVQYSGLYTVTASKTGEETFSEYITMTQDGVVYSLEMLFKIIIYDQSFGWNEKFSNFLARAKPRLSSGGTGSLPTISYSDVNKGILTITSGSTNYTGSMYINQTPIDVTNWTTLKVYGTLTPTGGGYTHTGVYATNNPSYCTNFIAGYNYSETSSAKTNCVVDISGVTGDAYIGLCPCRNTSNAKYEITRISLEKIF